MTTLNLGNPPTIDVPPQGEDLLKRELVAPIHVQSQDIHLLDQALREFNASDNELINASTNLLAVCGILTQVKHLNELDITYVELSREIIDLKYKIVSKDYLPSIAENLCLLFAIVIDELIMVNSNNRNYHWGNHTLVAGLFGLRDGGDRFYKITERALMQPRALHDFIEIIHIFLKLGFRGKYINSNEQERNRLINSLEVALNLSGRANDDVESLSRQLGRSIKETFPPRNVWSIRKKSLLCILTLMLMLLSVTAYKSWYDNITAENLIARRTETEKVKPDEYVYSSKTGKTITRPRQ